MGQGNRLLVERALVEGVVGRKSARGTASRPAKSVTINVAESPLGWLYSRRFVSRRQFDAGERLRSDWERGQLSSRVTMAWDAAPMARGRGGQSSGIDLSGSQIDAKRRFRRRLTRPARGSPTFCGGSSAAARGCARRKRRSAGPRAPASWC